MAYIRIKTHNRKSSFSLKFNRESYFSVVGSGSQNPTTPSQFMRLVSTAALSPGLYEHTLIGMPAIPNLANHVPCFSANNITYYNTENIRVCNILNVAPANNSRNSLHGRATAFLIPRFCF
nr:MAG TPA: hypothetical protein [Caudoviricetes sp.]